LVPEEAAGVAAVITHEGGFPIGWFIAGYDTWFRKPPITNLKPLGAGGLLLERRLCNRPIKSFCPWPT
jgi:hypothetical protein